MKVRRQFPNTEAEGGAPETSAYDVATSSIPTFPHNHIIPFQAGGVTKASTMFSGIAGLAPEGMGSVQPTVVPDYWYFGEAPLDLQPLINKPNPWEI